MVTKKNIFIILIIFSLIGGGILGFIINKNLNQQNEDYLATLQLTEYSILSSVITSIELCELYSDTWRIAIDRGRDFSTEVNSKITQNESKIGELVNSKENIDVLMKELNNPPEGFVKTHEKMLEIYGIYTELYSQAKGPSGSLMTFNQNINKLQEDFLRANNELGILVPDLETEK